MSRSLLAATVLAFLLSACTAVTWDPTLKVSSDAGHITGARKPPVGEKGGDAEAEVVPLEGLDAQSQSPQEAEKRYSGRGTFIKKVATQEQPEAPGDITLNFDNTDIREVVKVILGDLLGLNYILDPAVNGSVTMETGRPLRRDLLLPTLETLLRMNNAALVPNDGIYKVMASGNAIKGNVVPQLGETIRPLPRGYSVQVVPLNYIGATEMNQILAPLAPDGSIIRVDTVRNLLIVAGSSPELGKLLETVEIFDVDWIKGLSVGFFRLEYSKVADVMTQLNTLLGAADNNPLAGLFRLIPVETANSLLVITPQERYLDEISTWIKRLDQVGDEGDGGERLYVYRVKHGNAENLANIISQLFSGRSGSGVSAPRVAPGLAASTIKSAPTSGEAGSAAKSTPATGSAASTPVATGYSLDSGVSIVADTINNSLLIRSPPGEYRKIADALEKLDILPLQVLVEATIIEVSLSGELEYGLQWFFRNHFRNGYSGQGSWDGNLDGSDSSGLGTIFPGFNWSLIDQTDAVRAVFSAFASDGLVNVLSSPSVMVLDNHTAKIQVGDQVPIVNTQQQGTSATDRVVNSIEYRDTGVMLSVTPRVTPGGLVIMDVEQEVSDVASTSRSTVDSPTIQTRNISSSVAVKNEQVVVLGGLISDKRENNEGGVPGLYKVPVLGWAFGQTTKSASRKELVVVLTPRVIADDKDIENVNQDFKSRLKGLELEGRF